MLGSKTRSSRMQDTKERTGDEKTMIDENVALFG